MNSKNAIIMSGMVICSIIIQASLLPVYFITPFKPDLLLIIVVFLALRGSFTTGISLTWFLGILKDIFSGLYLGLNAFTFLLIFLVIKSAAGRLYAESGFLFVVIVGTSTVACVVLDTLLLLMFTNTPGIAYSMVIGLIPHLLVNAFTASLVALLPGFERLQEAA